MSAVLVGGALFLLPVGLGLVSPRSRHAVEPSGELVTPECEPPPSRLATPRPTRADEDSSGRALSAGETAHRAADAAGARQPQPASTAHEPWIAHEPGLVRLEIRVLGLARTETARLELLHEPADGAPARLTRHQSAADGRLALALAPGSVRAVAWSDHATAPPARAELVAASAATLELALEPSLPVLGRVLDAASGAPIAGASVSFWTFAELDTVTSGADGTFRHPRFPARAPAQQLAARAPGYGTSVRYLRHAADGAWKLSARHDGEASLRGTGTPWIELELVPERRVRGRVVDPDGAPVAGARVTVEGFQRVLASVASRDGAEGTCAADGSFELGGLRSDLGHALTIEAPGFAFEPLELAPAAGAVELGALALQPAACLSGVVIDADGLPVAGAEVVLRLGEEPSTPEAALDAGARMQGHERRVLTSPEGTFLFEGLWSASAWLGVETDAGAEVEAILAPRADGSFDAPCLTLGPSPALVQRSP